MEITYSQDREFTKAELEELFLSAGWDSGRYPERLKRAMRGYSLVISARGGGKLTGLICAMDDGEMTAYVHYLLVAPEWRGRGIGGRLTELAKEHYKDYLKIALIASDGSEEFYRRLGFERADGTPMYFTEMEN